MLLDYLDHPKADMNYGIVLVVLFFLCQLLRNISFNLQQSIGIHTGKRAPQLKKWEATFCSTEKRMRV